MIGLRHPSAPGSIPNGDFQKIPWSGEFLDLCPSYGLQVFTSSDGSLVPHRVGCYIDLNDKERKILPSTYLIGVVDKNPQK